MVPGVLEDIPGCHELGVVDTVDQQEACPQRSILRQLESCGSNLCECWLKGQKTLAKTGDLEKCRQAPHGNSV